MVNESGFAKARVSEDECLLLIFFGWDEGDTFEYLARRATTQIVLIFQCSNEKQWYFMAVENF